MARQKLNGPLQEEIFALKRERIFEAATELFYERGYENTTLDAVAERLSVTKPFIYSYYKSKAELLAEICQRGIRASLDEMDRVLAMAFGPVERLRKLGEAFTGAVLRSQMHIAIFAREEKNLSADDFKRVSDLRREFDRKLNRLLEEGCEAGVFHLKDRRIATLAIGGMVSWAYVWYRGGGRLDASEIAERMSELILALVGAGERSDAAKGRGRRSRRRGDGALKARLNPSRRTPV
jgi:TetR/AcrR family transcriptional regulator, cholesterol catabolism regulator